jgi:hypothetical protein
MGRVESVRQPLRCAGPERESKGGLKALAIRHRGLREGILVGGILQTGRVSNAWKGIFTSCGSH